MNIDKLKEFASTILHCGDYGELWVNESTGDVCWVAGDADFDADEVKAGVMTSWDNVIDGFLAVEGVNSVDIQAEGGPGEDGYTNLGKFGIDNYDLVKKLYGWK